MSTVIDPHTTGDRHPLQRPSPRERALANRASPVPAQDFDHTVLLDSIWPGCLKGRSPVVTCWLGNAATTEWKFRIINGRGRSREFPISAVPKVLWPTNVAMKGL